jgi:hypothetical protein
MVISQSARPLWVHTPASPRGEGPIAGPMSLMTGGTPQVFRIHRSVDTVGGPGRVRSRREPRVRWSEGVPLVKSRRI